MNDENTLWMGDIEPMMTESIIMNSFQYFNIYPINVKFIKDKKKNINRTYCFVRFKNIQDAKSALNLNGIKMPMTSSKFRLNWADGQTSAMKTVYVGNLNLKVGDNELYKLFSERYKSVHHASVITENGVSKGFGFVLFKNEEDYSRCLKEMNGINFYGNNIKVNEKRKKDDDIKIGVKNIEKNKNLGYEINKVNIDNFLKNNKNKIESNMPFIYQNNIYNINNDIHNNKNILQNNNFNTNMNNNNLLNNINKINNINYSLKNNNNIFNFNTRSNINVINNNIIKEKNINNFLNNSENNNQSIEYLLNGINNSNNLFGNQINKSRNSLINENTNINNLKNYINNNSKQLENKNNFIINKSKINNNVNNSNINKNKINENKNGNYFNNQTINDNSELKKEKINNKLYNLEVLEDIDEDTLLKKIHESILRTFEYHKQKFINNGTKFKSKFIIIFIIFYCSV